MSVLDGGRSPGLVERFRLAVAAAFVESNHFSEPFEELTEARRAFRKWLVDYNKEQQQGFPTFDRAPVSLFRRKAC